MTKVMKKVVIAELSIGTLLLIGLGLAGLFLPTSSSDAHRFSRIVEKRIDTVVHIKVASIDGMVGGAGVVISKHGHILTAAHLFDHEELQPLVTFTDGRTKVADIIQSHTDSDLAVIKVNSWTPEYSPLADLDALKIGQEVVAIGHPIGLDYTVTHGIISQVREEENRIQLAQTDTAVNPGNSGGPVYNMRGEIIGIVSSSYLYYEGLSFAVSIDAIHHFLDQFRGI